jgi:hypothetical protein
MTSSEQRRRRSLANDAAALSLAAILAALVAYALLLAVVNGLGSADAAPVVLIWSYWVLVTTALGAPVQQWILRNSVVGVGRSAERVLLTRLSGMVVGIAGMVTLASRILDERLFRSSSWIYPLTLGLVTIGAWSLGIARGRLAASGQYYALAVSLPAENLIRLITAACLVAAGADARGFALVVPAGYVILVALRTVARHPVSRGSAGASGGLLGSLTAIALISQMLFSTVPFAVALGGGSQSAVTATFAVLAAARIPHLMTSAMSSRILESMTRLGVDEPRRIWSLRLLTIATVPPVALGGAVLAAWMGREVVRWVFDLDEAMDAIAAALIVFGALVAVGVLLLALTGVAVGRPVPVVLSGLVALATGFCLTFVPAEPVLRASLAFAIAEIVYFAGLTGVAVHERHRAATVR